MMQEDILELGGELAPEINIRHPSLAEVRFRFYQEWKAGIFGDDPIDAARRALHAIDELDIWTRAVEKQPEWRDFVFALQQLADYDPPVTPHKSAVTPDSNRDMTPYDRRVA